MSQWVWQAGAHLEGPLLELHDAGVVNTGALGKDEDGQSVGVLDVLLGVGQEERGELGEGREEQKDHIDHDKPEDGDNDDLTHPKPPDDMLPVLGLAPLEPDLGGGLAKLLLEGGKTGVRQWSVNLRVYTTVK